MLILGIALAGVLVLCAGGGIGAWLLLRNSDRDGAANPLAAVESFLRAVYHDRDASGAASLVCSEARDEAALQTKIDELNAYTETQISPEFAWAAPEIVDRTDDLTVVAVTVSMITGDERLADQTLHVSVLDKDPHGWWVCDLETVTPADEQDGGTDPDGETSDEEGGDEDGGEEGGDGG